MSTTAPREPASSRSCTSIRRIKINVVLALFERAAGNEAGARALLRSVAANFPGAPAFSAVDRPLAEWPADLHGMTLVARRDAQVAAPPAH